jgi:predicted nucleic acid-binding protein
MLDTSFVVRYLTGDPQYQAAAAATVIDSDRRLVVSAIGLAEVWYVLRDRYQIPRAAALRALIDLVGRSNVRVLGLPKGRVIEALALLLPSNRLSIADALMWAEAREARMATMYSFDGSFPDDELQVLSAASDEF